MPVAGVQQPQAKQQMKDIFDMGIPSSQRNALATIDINGDVKRNRYGHVMQVDRHLVDQFAGQIKG